jgi:hypothetical protein
MGSPDWCCSCQAASNSPGTGKPSIHLGFSKLEISKLGSAPRPLAPGSSAMSLSDDAAQLLFLPLLIAD